MAGKKKPRSYSMTITLEDLAFQLNKAITDEGTTFDAAMTAEEGVLEVICSNNEEFPVHIAQTETQILTITPLFKTSEVAEGKVDELNTMLLQLSPAVPLSAVGLQGDTYILFGAMALESSVENVLHELEVQAENTLEVLEIVESLLV
jgi:uncharacterized protein